MIIFIIYLSYCAPSLIVKFGVPMFVLEITVPGLKASVLARLPKLGNYSFAYYVDR